VPSPRRARVTGARLARHGASLIVWSLIAGGVACRRGSAPPTASSSSSAAAPSPPLSLGAVTVRDVTTSGVLPEPLDLGALQDQLQGRLAASGIFAVGAPDAGAARALVRVHVDVSVDGAEVEDKGVARATVRLRLDTRPSDVPGALDEDLAGEGEQIYPIRSAASAKRGGAAGDKRRGALGASPSAAEKRALFAKLVSRVGGDLLDGFIARERLRTATAETIHAALRADGGDLQEQAIRIAGERKLGDEVPVLLELLEHPNETVRDAALGALIQIGDRRAVTALTKTRSMRDRREMRKILEAISTLGGDEALDYLSFVAASHDDEEIRALAAAAKGRLERRQGAKAPAKPSP
jgi:hypothetical protein